jgi:capsular polysaccharide biosynthesis protein
VQDINLYHLLRFYVKKWPLIISLTIFGVVAGFIYNQYIQIPLYKSNATLLVVDSTVGSSSQNSNLINNYVDLFKSRRVIQPVIDDLKLSTSYNDLVSSISATNNKNTEVIVVSITDKDAQTSKAIAEGAVASFKNEVAQLYGKDNIQVVDDANLATEPCNVRKPLVLALAAAVGLLISVITLFFVYDFNLSRGIDSSIDDPDSVKPTLRQKLTARYRAWRLSCLCKRKFTKNPQELQVRKKSANKTRAKKSSKKPSAKKPRSTSNKKAAKSVTAQQSTPPRAKRKKVESTSNK